MTNSGLLRVLVAFGYDSAGYRRRGLTFAERVAVGNVGSRAWVQMGI
jgi:hypothetical protein